MRGRPPHFALGRNSSVYCRNTSGVLFMDSGLDTYYPSQLHLPNHGRSILSMSAFTLPVCGGGPCAHYPCAYSALTSLLFVTAFYNFAYPNLQQPFFLRKKNVGARRSHAALSERNLPVRHSAERPRKEQNGLRPQVRSSLPVSV